MQIRFRIDIEPQGAKRHRVRVVVPPGFRRGGPDDAKPPFASPYADPDEVAYQKVIRDIAAPHMPAGVMFLPLKVDLLLVTQRPKSLPKSHGKGRYWSTVKPDVDNALKAILDAMREWFDDKIVASTTVWKQVAAEGESPHMIVCLRTLDPLPQ